MIINRVYANANKWTFKIKPIQELVYKYVGNGCGWVDPFAGMYSPAEFTNDLNPESNAKSHTMAEVFCKNIDNKFNGVLFDPPYSYRQISECYKGFGIKPTQLDTSYRYYNSVMNAICDKIIEGGMAISFGWNTNGFGKNRGFKIVEILICAHGQHKNDTLVTVEKKAVI